MPRLAAAVEKEAQHGVPLQHLAEMVNVQGFDSDRWVQAQPKDNEVSSLHAEMLGPCLLLRMAHTPHMIV